MGESLVQVYSCAPCSWHTRHPHKAKQHLLDNPDHPIAQVYLRESEVAD